MAHANDRTAAIRVLVVDDVADNREILTGFLEHLGFQTACACNGLEALEQVELFRPDAIIMDLGMPVMDGWEATARIKAEPRSARIPVIVLTGFGDPHDVQRARAAGADEVYVKPQSANALAAKIRELMAQKN